MRAFILLLLFAISQICQAFTTPDIYTLTQPAGASPDLGENSQPPAVPSKSRSGDPSQTTKRFTDSATKDTQLGRVQG